MYCTVRISEGETHYYEKAFCPQKSSHSFSLLPLLCGFLSWAAMHAPVTCRLDSTSTVNYFLRCKVIRRDFAQELDKLFFGYTPTVFDGHLTRLAFLKMSEGETRLQNIFLLACQKLSCCTLYSRDKSESLSPWCTLDKASTCFNLRISRSNVLLWK